EGRTPHDATIVFDHHRTWIEVQRTQQLEQGLTRRHGARLSVHDDVDTGVHWVSSSTIRRAVCAGSPASQSARMAATPQAPARRTSTTRTGVTPPIATAGRPSRATARNVSSPIAARSGWVGVAT